LEWSFCYEEIKAMKNVAMTIEGTEEEPVLVLRVGLNARFDKSRSGNTTIVATSNGNAPLPEPHDAIKFGLNVYTKE
jgi:hypothetical protein